MTEGPVPVAGGVQLIDTSACARPNGAHAAALRSVLFSHFTTESAYGSARIILPS